MATVGHLAVGAAIGRAFADPRERGIRLMGRLALAACAATAPDLDLALRLGGVDGGEGPAGHRGATHSIAAGGFLAAALRLTGASRRDALCYGLAWSSHGLTDLLSSRDQGVAVLWPMSSERLASDWSPVPNVLTASTIRAGQFLPSLARELALFLPVALIALWPPRRRRGGTKALRG
jgi:membrane-bound metal-dependent hydrolase YbcI (DUF457 family)